MLRMAHRIAVARTEDVVEMTQKGDRFFSKEDTEWTAFQDACRDAVSVVADNVAAYKESTGKVDWVYPDHFPCSMPFGKSVLIEWNRPKLVNIDGKMTPMEAMSFAVLLRTTDITDEIRVVKQVPQSAAYVSRVDISCFCQKELRLSMVRAAAFFKADGDLAEAPTITAGKHRTEHGFVLWAMASEAISMSMLTMSFSNCKNVAMREAGKECEPDRTWANRRSFPHIKYHVLNIEPMKQVLKTEGRSDEIGLPKALHLCRGHFATYTEEKPLFGKYAGRFFIPQHTRSKAERGIVLKDYAVKIG